MVTFTSRQLNFSNLESKCGLFGWLKALLAAAFVVNSSFFPLYGRFMLAISALLK